MGCRVQEGQQDQQAQQGQRVQRVIPARPAHREMQVRVESLDRLVSPARQVRL